ncbi:MAG: hypothetical protein MR399_03800 [Clostridiales bacterium]|nr:hypothetical protein [Clostridiales bacterium]
MTTAHLRSKINRYFNQCRDEGTPPTPAGLALALDMRTAELTQAPMDDESRRLIDRALQRIEVGTLELLLNKSAARGLEIILQNTSKSAVPDRLGGLSDDELDERLIRLARRIAALSGKTSDEKEELA